MIRQLEDKISLQLPKERSKHKMNVLRHLFGLKISKKSDV